MTVDQVVDRLAPQAGDRAVITPAELTPAVLTPAELPAELLRAVGAEHWGV